MDYDVTLRDGSVKTPYCDYVEHTLYLAYLLSKDQDETRIVTMGNRLNETKMTKPAMWWITALLNHEILHYYCHWIGEDGHFDDLITGEIDEHGFIVL